MYKLTVYLDLENINKDSWKYNLQLLEETSDEFKLMKVLKYTKSLSKTKRKQCKKQQLNAVSRYK